MALNLDIDIELLTKYAYLFDLNGINSSEKSSGEQENAKGAEGVKFYKQKGYNKSNLVKDLNLNDPKVRYSLIRMLKNYDITKLLYKMEKKDLLRAMKFFTHDKLVSILSALPEEILSTMLQKMFSPKEIMSLLPKKTVDKYLQSNKISKKYILEFMQKEMKPEELREMLSYATGTPVDTMDKDKLVGTFAALKPEIFKESLTYMSYKSTKEMGAFILERQPETLQEIPSEKMAACLDKSMKSEIIDGMSTLEPEVLGKIAENLPPELLEQVVTMLDPEVFAEYLLENGTDVLDELV